MPAVSMLTTEAAELADLLSCLREWIDAEEDQLDPLLDKHGYDLIGLRVGLDRFTSLLANSGDGEPPF
ncbi:MAG: hypothetical protein M3O87_00530 [Candidatus Dormibacteraeota bacterium]|nr:hypothetical protein [Candidatus Dormibacteraeota bacterium]